MKKNIISIFIPIAISIIVFSGLIYIGISNKDNKELQEDKIHIIATLFPTYDFAKQIAKDKAEVTMLLPIGAESHSYEPTPQDIININKADLFIYTGAQMEMWADNIIKSTEVNNVLDVSKGIKLLSKEEIENYHEDENEHNHEHEFEPHIWTNPNLAVKMCENITESLCNIDPQNSNYYKQNAEEYINKLKELDKQIKQMVQTSKRKKIVSGSRFPFIYFVREYDLEYVAAYDSCNTEAQPSAKVVAELVDIIKRENIPVIYYEELSEPLVARAISEQTGCKMLLLHSAHNVSKQEFDSNINYLEIMKKNLENLKEGLN